MTAFDLYQFATVQIGSGDRDSAAKTLARAIRRIDKDGVDREMRGDLVALRQSVLRAAAMVED